jgi:hypothetical protein
MAKVANVSKVAVGLVVAGGVIWVGSAVLYSAQIVSCFTCGSILVAPGVNTSGYPVAALRTLAWGDLYATTYIATLGLLAIILGLTEFKRGEKWAWYAIAVVVLAGVLTGVLDELSWGGWYTFLFLGLPSLLGLLLSAKMLMTGQPGSG